MVICDGSETSTLALMVTSGLIICKLLQSGCHSYHWHNIVELAQQSAEDYDLYEIMGTLDGQTFKERKLDRGEYPVAVQTLWTRPMHGENNEATPKNRLVLR